VGRVCGGLDREMRKLPPSNGLPLVNTLPFTYAPASAYNCTPFICTFPNSFSFFYNLSLSSCFLLEFPSFLGVAQSSRIRGTLEGSAGTAKLMISRFHGYTGFEPL
jgi:hypothetical protein